MRKPNALAIGRDRIARGDVRAHGTTDRLEVGQRDPRVPKPRRFAHEFLGMARPEQEAVIALHGEFAPPPRRSQHARHPHTPITPRSTPCAIDAALPASQSVAE